MPRSAKNEIDDARLLPRHRNPLADRRAMERAQAGALLAALEANPTASLPLRHALTKPGDKDALRGLPAVARGVPGVQPGTDPLREVLRKERQAERRGL